MNPAELDSVSGRRPVCRPARLCRIPCARRSPVDLAHRACPATARCERGCHAECRTRGQRRRDAARVFRNLDASLLSMVQTSRHMAMDRDRHRVLSHFWQFFLVFNVVRETRRGRARSLGRRQPHRRAGVAYRAGYSGPPLIAILWGLWTSPTFSAFFDSGSSSRHERCGDPARHETLRGGDQRLGEVTTSDGRHVHQRAGYPRRCLATALARGADYGCA